MKYVITGGAGFIGMNLLRALAGDRACDVVIVDDLSNSSLERLGKAISMAGKLGSHKGADAWTVKTGVGESRFRHICGDIRDAALARNVTRGADAVIHLAAQTGVAGSLADPSLDMSLNVQGTFNYLDACRVNGVPRMIGASSAAVLGDGAGEQSEDMPTRPGTPYGASKASGEAYLSAYARSFGLRTISLRFANVYGPLAWSKGSVVAAFCKSVLAGRPMTIYGTGDQVRDFLHVGDICRIILSILDDDRADVVNGGALNVATGIRTTVLDLASRVSSAFSRLGMAAEVALADPRHGDVLRSAPDISRLRNILPDHTFTGLEQGLSATVDWFVKEFAAAGEGVATP